MPLSRMGEKIPHMLIEHCSTDWVAPLNSRVTPPSTHGSPPLLTPLACRLQIFCTSRSSCRTSNADNFPNRQLCKCSLPDSAQCQVQVCGLAGGKSRARRPIQCIAMGHLISRTRMQCNWMPIADHPTPTRRLRCKTYWRNNIFNMHTCVPHPCFKHLQIQHKLS